MKDASEEEKLGFKRSLAWRKQLLTPQWRAFRQIILRRDSHKCQCCGANKAKEVHHVAYDSSRTLKAWEYPENFCISVCPKCHLRIHLEDTVLSINMDPNFKAEKINYEDIEL